MKNEKISIVIPCYGSENTIESVVNNCIVTLEKRENKYEIILVNDCSFDGVWGKIKKLHSKYPKAIIGVNFTKNFGQHSALMAGYREATGDIIVSMDDDGQTDPKQLWRLIDKLKEGYDVVFARYPELKENWYRRLGSSLNRKMAEFLIDKPKDVNGTSYFAIKKCIVNDMIKYEKPYVYIGGLIYRSTNNIGEVDIDHLDRIEGNSGYSLKKLINLILNGFTAFSIKPLRIATVLGSIIAIFGFIYGIVIIIRRLTNSIIEIGYSSIMASILFIGGIIMLLLGLIGEYIGRIYISINNSPQYVIKEKIDVNVKEKKK